MLEKDINEELRQALKAGEKTKTSALRMLLNEIQNKKIAEKVKELDDEKVTALVQKMARQHKEAIEQFKKAGREDLVSKEEEELAALEKFLPEQISGEELEKIISETIAQTGASSPKDMGRVMKDVMSRVQGRADGKVVSEMTKKKLTK